ncbi:MAG: hypothetical protein ACU0BK_07280 [Shimia sp.]|uniref:hypothetical protein n=1 Tax=Shimia sp. TaxID=1954381 RepID=UPI004058DA98
MKPLYAALCAAGLTLAACSQPEPAPVYMQPNFDKAGNASCDAGYDLVTTETGSMGCAPAS